jgi:hypothetical protein
MSLESVCGEREVSGFGERVLVVATHRSLATVRLAQCIAKVRKTDWL